MGFYKLLSDKKTNRTRRKCSVKVKHTTSKEALCNLHLRHVFGGVRPRVTCGLEHIPVRIVLYGVSNVDSTPTWRQIYEGRN